MSATSQPSTPKWDPEPVLKIRNNGRCISSSLFKRATRLSYEDAAQVGFLLGVIAEQEPHSALNPWLHEPSSRSLCPRHHKQCEAIVREWQDSICAKFPKPAVEPRNLITFEDVPGTAIQPAGLRRQKIQSRIPAEPFAPLSYYSAPIIPATPPAPRCPLKDVPSISLDYECPICYDNELLAHYHPDYSAQCKTECGKSVHKE